MKIVLASHNAGKLVEMRRLVAAADLDVTVLGLGDFPAYPEPAETESTFEGNALLKARAALAETGVAALADDSGLAVDVLNGMPGVRSARWSGPDATDVANNDLLVRQLADVAPERRTARFLCSVALVLPDGREFTRPGEVSGRLLSEPRGQNGFGYDPLFLPDGQTLTTAELDAPAKDAISHRGRAMRAIVAVLAELVHEGAGA